MITLLTLTKMKMIMYLQLHKQEMTTMPSNSAQEMTTYMRLLKQAITNMQKYLHSVMIQILLSPNLVQELIILMFLTLIMLITILQL